MSIVVSNKTSLLYVSLLIAVQFSFARYTIVTVIKVMRLCTYLSSVTRLENTEFSLRDKIVFSIIDR